jgi:hypothetical protein
MPKKSSVGVSFGTDCGRLHAEEIVRRGLLRDGLRQAVLLPDEQGLLPEAEVPDRTAVDGPVVHDGGETFPVVHRKPLLVGARG